MERGVSTLELSAFEISRQRGFLPAEDPLTSFGDSAHPHLKYLEELGLQIPELLQSHRLRPTVRSMKPIDLGLFEGLRRRELVMAARVYAFLTSAYVHQLDEETAKTIPASLAVPFSHISSKLGRRFPILSYDLYALNNWRRTAPSAGITLGNLDTIQKFVRLRDEPWFILVHVEIEAEAAPAIAAIGPLQQAVMKRDRDALLFALQTVAESLSVAIATLKRMPEQNSPDLYAFTFRPYIQMFEGVVFEGGEARPATLRGETGAQSSIIPSLDLALGVRHAKTGLTDYVADMRNYMPAAHRAFIEAVEKNETARPVRDVLLKEGNSKTREAYNICLEKIIEFRQQHLEFATNYIFTRVEDPSGTGGTPFMKWLAQLRDETSQHMIRV